MRTTNPWTILRKDEPFTCPQFTIRSDLVTLSGGQPLVYNSVRTKEFNVSIVPIDAQGRTMLVGQYRYVVDRCSWEVPGGGAPLDRPAIASARRELSEETGYRAEHWLQICDTPTAPSTLDSRATGFVAWGLHEGEAHPEPEEDLSQRLVPFSEAIEMVLSGEIGSLASVALLLSLQTKLLRGELPQDLTRLLV